MGPSVVILFSLYSVLIGQPIEQRSVEDCCKDGKERGQQKQDCTALPLISESTTCRVAQEQCCVAVLEDTTCTSGINMAKDQGACETLLSQSPCETKTAKMCCDCCLLGKAAQELGMGCDITLSVGYQCGLVSRACCLDGFPEEQTKATSAPVKDAKSPSDGEDPLLSDQCKGAGQCAQRCQGNGTCICFEGYKLKPDSRSCEDINECLLGSHSCRPGERCINTDGSYRCQREVSCGTGYELTDNNNCKDIDECETGTHNCAAEFECQNTLGSFRCRPRVKCGEGFIQDALGKCIDINECLSQTGPCKPGQTCINTVGSYTCHKSSVNCGRGYRLNEAGTRCVDVDECMGTDGPCQGHTCINLVGSYRCECRTGFLFNSISRICEDINECRHYPGRLCAHKCDNVLGSYQCSCMPGFRLASDGRNCDDVNECESSPCSQECANVYGSYQCYCRRGYQLSDVDGVTCEDIDECALPTGGHICSYRCHNTPGSFHCTCPSPGYTLAPNGRSCQDIDECVTGTHSCSEAESCFNVQGGFRCLAFECPNNYRRSGDAARLERSDSVRCIKSCQPNDVSCILDPIHSISYTVISLPTFREETLLEEIVYLRAVSPAVSSTRNNDIIFDILEGNSLEAFDIIKRNEHGMTVGIVRQVRPITGPKHIVLKLAMNYVVSGVVSHRNIVNVHVFVSEFWF
ncbi:fibulin-1-like isoform X2 [Megalops cyprinoides]|uniref:fibulin-1-like isoform X2 n=1 Tax=Megalops cyprinoides TaxID=118141 RepID=UPI0018649010|nr:fibulin-1-like isoform X2 [Megalops cyprinoides]